MQTFRIFGDASLMCLMICEAFFKMRPKTDPNGVQHFGGWALTCLPFSLVFKESYRLLGGTSVGDRGAPYRRWE